MMSRPVFLATFLVVTTICVDGFRLQPTSSRAAVPTVTSSSSTTNVLSKPIKQFLGTAAALLISFGAAPSISLAASGEDVFVDNVATMIVSKKILEPVDNFVQVSAYDNARTNVKYIMNQLQLQKNADSLVRNSLDFCDDPDLIDSATEAAGRVTTTAQNVDSSVYTVVFIPASDDGSQPPNALKYRKEAIDYLKSFRNDLDLFIKVADSDRLAKAQTIANSRIKDLPPVLFKVVKEAPKPAGY